MKAEEQLINDILVIEEKIMYEMDYDDPQQSTINKLKARRLDAVKEYAKDKAANFMYNTLMLNEDVYSLSFNDMNDLFDKYINQ